MPPPHSRTPLPAAPLPFRPRPLFDLKKLAKFPQAAKQRELVKVVHKFSGNGVHLFIHYNSPILEARRKTLLAIGTTKKQYSKSASQLWTALDDEHKLFWDHQAKLIRLGIANSTLNHEQCVENAGFQSEWRECMRFSELAVAEYLHISLPDYIGQEEREEIADTDPVRAVGLDLKAESIGALIKAVETFDIGSTTKNTSPQDSITCIDLLDTLREPLTVDPRMIYGNFAQLFPYDTVRSAEGKRQTAMLRQLADLLEPTGRELFYYFATPHLWKTIRPTEVDETISSVAHRLWMFMPGHLRKRWEMESAWAKKLLGDGNVEGLDRLQLDADFDEVWTLHEMTEEAMKMQDVKRVGEVADGFKEECDTGLEAE